MKWIYSEASQKQWEKVTPEEKKLARQIYRQCTKTTQKKLTFTINRPAIVMNALQVIFFPYDDNDGYAWWWNEGKEVEISIKKFNQMVTRNKVTENELARLKKYLRLTKISPRERVQAIHDYICEDVDYDYKDSHTTLYDALFAKTVICIGYSTVMKALCDQGNVPCEILSDKTHAWNRVMIDNEWLYIDATWDDYFHNEKYFMLPESEFYKIHPKHTQVNKEIWAK